MRLRATRADQRPLAPDPLWVSTAPGREAAFELHRLREVIERQKPAVGSRSWHRRPRPPPRSSTRRRTSSPSPPADPGSPTRSARATVRQDPHFQVRSTACSATSTGDRPEPRNDRRAAPGPQRRSSRTSILHAGVADAESHADGGRHRRRVDLNAPRHGPAPAGRPRFVWTATPAADLTRR